jgi:hypothetical protein
VKTNVLFAAAATAAIVASAAQAAPTTVYNTELGAIAPGSTTTDNTGTRSTNPAAGTLGGEGAIYDQWGQQNVRGNGVVGITTDYADNSGGNGSIYFAADGSGPSKADMEIYFSTPVLLSEFTGGSYDWFKDSASVGDAPAPAYRLAMLNANNQFGYFVYEPYQQPHAVPLDTWVTETIDTTTSLFWATGSNFVIPPPGGAPPHCQSCLHSLDEWSAANAGAKVIGFSTGVGSGWTAGPFVGAVDNVSFTFGQETSTFNFEVSAVPEPGVWALMITGFGLAGAALRRRSR